MFIVPFNAFAEVTEPALQQEALATIRAHLASQGRLICTLHNPVVRLRASDGQIHCRGKYALPGQAGTLFLWTLENHDPGSPLVKGAQFYELYDAEGRLQSKRFVDLQFFVHTRESFETLACSQGYGVAAVYGDYARAEFQAEASPFMIWVLDRQ